MECSIKACHEPRHVARTGQPWATICDAHDAMVNVLQHAIGKRSGRTHGATALLRSTEAKPGGLSVIEAEFRRRGWPPNEANELLRRMEAARDRARTGRHPPTP